MVRVAEGSGYGSFELQDDGLYHLVPSFTEEEIESALKQGTLVRELQKSYTGERYDKGTNKFKIRFYETNKIRLLLARFYNVGGYPVKFYNHVGYFSGIAQWVPDQWMIMPKLTRDGWITSPHTKWVDVMIMKIDLYDTFQAGIAAAQAKSAGAGMPIIGGILSNIASSAELTSMSSTMKWIKIYPNLLFYNTINDLVIWANWNLILEDLNKIERLKYLPSIEDVSEPVFPTR